MTENEYFYITMILLLHFYLSSVLSAGPVYVMEYSQTVVLLHLLEYRR